MYRYTSEGQGCEHGSLCWRERPFILPESGGFLV